VWKGNRNGATSSISEELAVLPPPKLVRSIQHVFQITAGIYPTKTADRRFHNGTICYKYLLPPPTANQTVFSLPSQTVFSPQLLSNI
jgi:hypothetical protein